MWQKKPDLKVHKIFKLKDGFQTSETSDIFLCENSTFYFIKINNIYVKFNFLYQIRDNPYDNLCWQSPSKSSALGGGRGVGGDWLTRYIFYNYTWDLKYYEMSSNMVILFWEDKLV